MSQYLSFYLKKKDNPEISICLGYFCTTIAREISSLGAFPYIEEDTLLDSNSFSTYLENIKEEIEDNNNNLQKCIKDKQETEQNVFKCSSQEVAKVFIEQIEESKHSIDYYKEEIDKWNWIVELLTFYSSASENNKEEWDLYYSNC